MFEVFGGGFVEPWTKMPLEPLTACRRPWASDRLPPPLPPAALVPAPGFPRRLLPTAVVVLPELTICIADSGQAKSISNVMRRGIFLRPCTRVPNPSVAIRFATAPPPRKRAAASLQKTYDPINRRWQDMRQRANTMGARPRTITSVARVVHLFRNLFLCTACAGPRTNIET